ncbi:hypothetical protein [Methanosphaera stadtmanae]|nr:hypothetical protein [Methanosphaera stadtmanae]
MKKMEKTQNLTLNHSKENKTTIQQKKIQKNLKKIFKIDINKSIK